MNIARTRIRRKFQQPLFRSSLGPLGDGINRPSITVPGSQAILLSSAPLVFASSISVSDAVESSLEITLTFTGGTITLDGTTGLSFDVGDGTADATMTFSGTITNINNALSGMSVTAGSTGDRTLAIVATNTTGSRSANVAVQFGSVPAFTVDPAISGDTDYGNVLTCSDGTVTGYPTPTLTRQWQNEGTNIGGETGATYTSVFGDVGEDITCEVTATNVFGSDMAETAAVTIVDPDALPAVLSDFVDDLEVDPPALLFTSDQAGTVHFDYHSSATPPAVDGGDIGFDTDTAVSGANNYSLDLSDYAGQTFYVHIRVTNSNGTSNTLTSQEITVALIDVPQHFYPNLGHVGNFVNPDVANAAATPASGQYFGYGFIAQEAMDVTHIGFYCGTITGGATATVSIESVNPATGLPNGSTVYGSKSNATLTANAWNLIALDTFSAGSAATFARNTPVFVKIAHGGTGTSFEIRRTALNGAFAVGIGQPYQVLNTGTPTRAPLAVTPLLALGSSSTTFYELPWAFGGISSFTQNNFNSGSSPAIRGMKFQLPFAARIIGVKTMAGNVLGDYTLALKDASNAELGSSSTTVDASLADQAYTELRYFDNGGITLAKNTVYYIEIAPTSVTNTSLPYWTFASTDYLQGNSQFGSPNFEYATFSAGTWTPVSNTTALIQLILDQR